MSQSTETETVLHVLKHAPIQLSNPVKITDTLQGSIWRASTINHSSPSSTNTVVLKLTSKHQHKHSISIVDNTVHHDVKENIILEQTILKHLTCRPNCPQTITKFIAFFETNDWFVLLQEDGGASLFDFTQNAHVLLRAGHIDICHWKSVVRAIFKQMIDCLAFIHSQNICHNDVSLENFLISIRIDVDAPGKVRFAIDDLQIKLCDFGVSELHVDSKCLSNKFCGKTKYKSLEVVRLKRGFDGKLNDIWGVGVCLFILSFGCPPWRIAHVSDERFGLFMDGRIADVLKVWHLCEYIDSYSLDLFGSIFKKEEDRISIDRVKQYLL